jgi:hypothetical protein
LSIARGVAGFSDPRNDRYPRLFAQSHSLRSREQRYQSDFRPYFHIRYYGAPAIYAGRIMQKIREKAIHAGLREGAKMHFAPNSRHPLVDELHSIENKGSIDSQESVDTFHRERKTNLVL